MAKNNNSIHVIHPYNKNGVWMFDDEEKNISKEPFVAGIPEMIEYFTKDIPKAEKGFTLYFSRNPLPNFHAHLTFSRKEGMGTYYKLKGTEMVGWLCPVLYQYFPQRPPRNLFCRFEPKKK